MRYRNFVSFSLSLGCVGISNSAASSDFWIGTCTKDVLIPTVHYQDGSWSGPSFPDIAHDYDPNGGEYFYDIPKD